MKSKKKQDNPLLNLLINLAIPALLLMKGFKWFGWGPVTTICVALAFPITYGLWDLIVKRKFNWMSLIGIVSIFITGGIGIFKLPKEYVAVKEAIVPLIIGAAVLISLKTKYPLVKTLLYNDNILNVEKVNLALKEKSQESAFDKLMTRSTYLISLSFLLSSFLNYTLAKVMIQSETGTQAFNEELGRMTAWSYPVIAVPCTLVMAYTLWQLLKGIKELTGLDYEEVFHHSDK